MKREFCDHDENAQNRDDEVPIGGTMKLSVNQFTSPLHAGRM